MSYIAAFSPKFTQIHHKYTKVAVSHRKSPKIAHFHQELRFNSGLLSIQQLCVNGWNTMICSIIQAKYLIDALRLPHCNQRQVLNGIMTKIPLNIVGSEAIPQIIPCIAPMLICVACGNGPAGRIMTAKGGFCHVK